MTLVSSRGKDGWENDPNTNLKDRDHIVSNRGYMNTHKIQGGYMNTHEINEYYNQESEGWVGRAL